MESTQTALELVAAAGMAALSQSAGDSGASAVAESGDALSPLVSGSGTPVGVIGYRRRRRRGAGGGNAAQIAGAADVSSACGAGDAAGASALVHVGGAAGRSEGVGAAAKQPALPSSACADAFFTDGKLPLVFAGGVATAADSKNAPAVAGSRRSLLGEALMRAGGSAPTYQTTWVPGEYMSTVESRVPRGTGRSRVMRCTGRAAGSASEAEEEAAGRLTRLLRCKRRGAVDDVTRVRENRLRHQALLSRAAAAAARAEKEQALLDREHALLDQELAMVTVASLDQGLGIARDDLLSISDECDDICDWASKKLGPEVGSADLADMINVLYDLSARTRGRAAAATNTLQAAMGHGA